MTEVDWQKLITLNRLEGLSAPRIKEEVIKEAAVTRSAARIRQDPKVLQDKVVQRIWIKRIKQAQEEEVWIHLRKTYMIGDLTKLSAAKKNTSAIIAPDYEVDEDGLMFFCPRSTPTDDLTGLMRLVVPDCCRKISYTTSTLVWKVDIRG